MSNNDTSYICRLILERLMRLFENKGLPIKYYGLDADVLRDVEEAIGPIIDQQKKTAAGAEREAILKLLQPNWPLGYDYYSGSAASDEQIAVYNDRVIRVHEIKKRETPEGV